MKQRAMGDAGAGLARLRSGGNVRRFLLQRNIKIGRCVTFSRNGLNRYNGAAIAWK